jgi:phosphatidylglycerol:prolipoprotein diacylglycerol transferase
MLPVLFSIGSIKIYTLAVFLGVGFFLASFLTWRRLRELGFDEKKIIDFLLLFSLFAFLFARLGFILTHFKSFGFSPLHWLLVGRFPGLALWGALLGGILVLFWFSRKNRWDLWRVADEVAFGFLPFFILVQMGCFFDGSILGIPTSMPWGMFFPGDFIRRQPVSLFSAILFFLIWILLLRVERRWRTWQWYKSQAEGFISLSFLGLALLVTFLLAFLEENSLYFLLFKKGLSLGGFLFVLGVFFRRSGLGVKQEVKR